MKAIGYIRVSTADHAREGKSLETQAQRIKGDCTSQNWELVNIEQGNLSAKDLNRRGLQRCLQVIEAHEVKRL